METCSLIATLPNINKLDKVHYVLDNPFIKGARINTGVNFLMPPKEVISLVKKLSASHNKPIWIDIKGRQLRITKWADPSYENIELNHDIDIVYPAKIYFRNGTTTEIIRTRGNKIIVDPRPKEVVGNGQSVNIIAKDIDIKGYLTPLDKEYLTECYNQELDNIMASFVEKDEDLEEIKRYHPNANIISKIESLKGIRYLLENNITNQLMAARDDLYIESGENSKILKLLKLIIEKDKNAICASRIFSSLERQRSIDLADYSDIVLMYNLGYRNFMLCDNICNYNFDQAINGWKELVK